MATPPPRDPELVVENVVFGYDDRQTVLDGVSLTANRGEILALLGTTGVGKTTLLRCIVGLLTPRAGRVLVRGRDVHAVEQDERDEILEGIGLAFQEAALLNSMTTAENIAFPIIERRAVDPETARMVAHMRLASVGLAGAGDKLPSELSGGMRKRAGIARALALEPTLLLLDEPSSGLDPTTARAMDDLILDLKARGDVAIVAVTHDVSSIETIADRAVMLWDGKVIASGTVDDLRATDDERVRAFFERTLLGRHARRSLVDELEWRPGR